MSSVNTCLQAMVKLLYFNKKHPENHIIRIKNKKEKRIQVYNGKRWITEPKMDIIDRIIQNIVSKLIDKWEGEFKEKATPFRYNLWVTKVKILVDGKDSERKVILKDAREKVEIAILDNQEIIKN